MCIWISVLTTWPASRTWFPFALGLRWGRKLPWNWCAKMYAMWMQNHMLVHNTLVHSLMIIVESCGLSCWRQRTKCQVCLQRVPSKSRKGIQTKVEGCSDRYWGWIQRATLLSCTHGSVYVFGHFLLCKADNTDRERVKERHNLSFNGKLQITGTKEDYYNNAL